MPQFKLPARLESIEPSQIRENMRIAREVDAINLAQGRPDFTTAPEIKNAAIRAIEEDHNQYSVTWGQEELRCSIAAMLQERFSISFDPETDITVTCGVTEAIVASLLAVVETGDEVVIIEPAHENYVPAIRFCGATPKFITLRPPDYELDLLELAAAMTSKTRVLIVNTPHNPSGKVFSRDELSSLLEVCRKHDCFVLTDEIYDQVTYAPYQHTAVASVADEHDGVITTGGISKTFATTGWRLGYVAAPPTVSRAIRMVHDYLTICAPTPFQHAALAAYQLPHSFYESLRSDYRRRRDCMMQVLRDSGFEPYEPHGAYYLLADFSRWQFDGSSEEFTRQLIADARVATVAGTAFYYKDKGLGNRLVRFAFAKTIETIEEAGERLARAFIAH